MPQYHVTLAQTTVYRELFGDFLSFLAGCVLSNEHRIDNKLEAGREGGGRAETWGGVGWGGEREAAREKS